MRLLWGAEEKRRQPAESSLPVAFTHHLQPTHCSVRANETQRQCSIMLDRQTDRRDGLNRCVIPAPVGNEGQACAAHRNVGRAHLRGFTLATTARLSGACAVWCRL